MISRVLNLEVSPRRNSLIWHLQDGVGKGRKYSQVTPLPFPDYFFCTDSQIPIIVKAYPEVKLSIEPASDTGIEHHFAEYELKDETVYKVELRSPNLKAGMRIKLEEVHDVLISEADVNYVDLVLKDLGVSEFIEIINGIVYPMEEPKGFPPVLTLFADFETDDRLDSIKASRYKSFVKPDTCRLLSAGMKDAQTGETFFYCQEDERALAKEIEAKFDEYHKIEFWNGEGFDKAYDKWFIRNGVKINWKRWIVMDSMIIHEIMNIKERQFVSLDKAGERYVNMRKIAHAQGFYDMYLDHIAGKKAKYPLDTKGDTECSLLEFYNLRDVEIMYALEKKFSFSTIILALSYNKNVGILPTSFRFARKPSIQAIMRASLNHHGKRIVWKSKSGMPIDKSYQGATTLDAVPGKHHNVIGIDLASLYNNVIQTWNISPEQLSFRDMPITDVQITTDRDHHTYDRFDHEGIMPKVLRIFEEDRNRYKNLRYGTTGEEYKTYDTIQAGLKIVLLAVTGGLGARGSTASKGGAIPTGPKSFYSWHCASDFTDFSRLILNVSIEVAERLGYEVIYGDTDSIYVRNKATGEIIELTEKNIIKMITDLVEAVDGDIQKLLDDWKVPVDKRKIKMEAQGLYEPFVLFNKKKAYFANMVYNAESGEFFTDPEKIEFYAKGVRMIQTAAPQFIKEFQKTIYTMVLQNKKRIEVQDFIDGNKVSFDLGKFDTGLVFERKIRKIKDYKMKSMHVKLAEKLVNTGKLQDGSTLFYVIAYMDIHGAVAKQEGHTIHASGRRYFWEHHVESWLKEIIEIVYPEQKTLDDFW